MKGIGTAIQIIVEFDRGLLQYLDVPQWNAFVADLLSEGLTPPVYEPGVRPPPIAVMLDFSRLGRARYNLDCIDLQLCWLEGADFTGASLRGARMGCGRDVKYAGSRLHGADFRDVEISGCDFTGCLGMETAMFVGAAFNPANPPVGLPASILAVCKAEAEPPPEDRRTPANPMEPTGFQQAPIKCHATIHTIPLE